jgi:hypothetical protein
MSKSDGLTNPSLEAQFMSPVELRRKHVQVRSLALAHMMSVLEAALRVEQEGKCGEGRFVIEVPLAYTVHPTWALKAELMNLRGLIEAAGWNVRDLKIENQCGPWLNVDMSEPIAPVSLGGPYR